MNGAQNHFSFIVTCFNLEKYIGECLDSLVNQKYPSGYFEIVCIDDESTDGSESILESYRKKFQNIVVRRIRNSGLEKACNVGLKIAKNDLVVRVDGDDILSRNFLAVMDRAVRENPGIDFYYCRDYIEYYSLKEQHRKRLPLFDAEDIFARGDFFATGTVYRKKDLADIGYFSEETKNCGLENYCVILEFLTKEKKGFAVSGASFCYRRHSANMSGLKRGAIVRFGKSLLKKYGREFKTNEYHPYGLTI